MPPVLTVVVAVSRVRARRGPVGLVLGVKKQATLAFTLRMLIMIRGRKCSNLGVRSCALGRARVN